MKLFLASEATHPISFPKISEVVGELQGKSIAYVPTAANGDGWGAWQQRESWKLLQTLGMKLEVVMLEDYRTAEVAKHLQGKDLIWFAGGYTGYLSYWLRRTELDKSLPEILEQGSVYIGSSAGSMVAGQSSDITNWYIGETEPGASYIPYLGLVDFDIYPHYEDAFFNEIQQKYTGKKIYLLKDGEAVFVDNTVVKVFGEGRIIEK